jgi:hypothetical protein
MPCVYLPGPAPAVTVANTCSEVFVALSSLGFFTDLISMLGGTARSAVSATCISVLIGRTVQGSPGCCLHLRHSSTSFPPASASPALSSKFCSSTGTSVTSLWIGIVVTKSGHVARKSASLFVLCHNVKLGFQMRTCAL